MLDDMTEALQGLLREFRPCTECPLRASQKGEAAPSASNNTCVIPLPTLDECIYMAVSADSGEGAFQHDCEIVKKVYEFISRQQHNT